MVSLNSTALSISIPSNGSGFSFVTLITAVVSFLAFILGVYNSYVRHKDKLPSIKAGCIEGFMDSGRDGEFVIFVEGYNNGQLPVTIVRYMFYLPKYHLGIHFNGMYKTKVLPGSNYRRWVPSDIFAEYLNRSDWFLFLKKQGIINDSKLPKTIKLEAWLVDEGERTYKSKPIEFDIENTLKNTNVSINEGMINSLISMTYYDPGETKRKIQIYKQEFIELINKIKGEH